MCRVSAVAADLQHIERGYSPPPTMVSAQRFVRFLGLDPPVSLERTTPYPASEYRPCMWYATSANPGILSIAFHEFSEPLQRFNSSTSIIAICEQYRRRWVRARAMETTHSQLKTYCCLPRERRAWVVLEVLLRVTPYASPVTLDLAV